MPKLARSWHTAVRMFDAVFADAAGEHDRRRPRPARPDMLPDNGECCADENVECQSRPLVAGGGGRFQVAHVAAHAAEAQQSALLGQRHRAPRPERFARLLHRSGKGERIEIARRGCCAAMPLCGLMPMLGGHALSVADCAQRARSAQVAGDDPQIAPAQAARPSARRYSDGWPRESPSGGCDALRPIRSGTA